MGIRTRLCVQFIGRAPEASDLGLSEGCVARHAAGESVSIYVSTFDAQNTQIHIL